MKKTAPATARLIVALVLSTLSTVPAQAEILREIRVLETPVSLMTPEQLAPYSWDSSPDASIEIDLVKDAYESGDPLQVFTRAFRVLRSAAATNDSVKVAAVKAVLDDMLVEYEPKVVDGDAYLWRYGYQYGKLAPGWWSGMDSLLGPLVYWSLGEVTGDERYKTIAIGSAKAAISSPEHGGVLWRDDKGCWISEYTWENMELSDEYHVLNGHLYGLQALYLLAAASQDSELAEAYVCAREGTQLRADSFFREDGDWNYYQTNPRIVSPAHYLLFEAAQFGSMYELTGDQFYLAQSNARKQVFARHFPVYLTSDSDGIRASVSAIGSPHPYWPDNYPFNLTCETATGIHKLTKAGIYDSTLSYGERLVGMLTLPEGPSKCSYRVIRGDFDMLVYEQTVFPNATNEYTELPTTFVGSYDAEGQAGDAMSIDRGTEARASFSVNAALTAKDILVFVVRPSAELQVSVIMTSTTGHLVHRNYPVLQPGCSNLVAINLMGFDNSEGFGDTIQSFTARIYTNTLEGPATAEFGNGAILRNPVQIQQYLADQSDGLCINLQ